MKINLKNDDGLIETAPVGFSWTTLFFGPLVPLFRGDFKWCLIMVLLCGCTVFFCNLVLAFVYNGIYIKGLLSKGFRAADDFSEVTLQKRGYIIVVQKNDQSKCEIFSSH